ncbi:MAG TPA: ParB/RepB/Spo0J family partition protein [Candidatus Faecousia excrementigallinarum]|uniref:ParB/RepB/Spo0J family partition protein n=1 Tax=Candidatus Faecousia excrementigallinarum TaxID=2840806 RepID=A0A9D1CMZ1_9FIRM|nr:ParB/RepB/Spo0J family partition protein [Candidatus Faecousia excrementigallinarum]
MTDEGRKESKLPRIHDIPLDQIDDMPNHPYKVRMDEDMEALVESVKNHGIITPVILRQKEDGRYECASGHRRRKAAELAGFPTIKAEVREMTRDEAIIIMAHSNRQRSRILPSEKAFSYKMELEALKRQGMRTDLSSGPVVQKLARDALGDMADENGRQISRYIRLTYLAPALLDMVDEGRIAFRPAVELSYLTEQEQADLIETIGYEDATPSLVQATKMKEFSREGRLNADVILSIMCEQKPNQKEKITFHTEKLKPYLPKNINPKQTEEYILKALEYYQRYRERMKGRGDR